MGQKEHINRQKYSSNLGDIRSVNKDSKCILIAQSTERSKYKRRIHGQTQVNHGEPMVIIISADQYHCYISVWLDFMSHVLL